MASLLNIFKWFRRNSQSNTVKEIPDQKQEIMEPEPEQEFKMEFEEVSFAINPNNTLDDKYPNKNKSLEEYFDGIYSFEGKVLMSSNPGKIFMCPDLCNGFVGTCLRAYNHHYNLIITPDDVWIAITKALAFIINKKSEKMRNLFVNHSGKIILEAKSGSDNIYTADYEDLINQITTKIKENTKGEISNWFQCNFSTTTQKIKTISQLILMGGMKDYFGYKMSLCCGIPQMTLRGTKQDWMEIKNRIQLMKTWDMDELTKWTDILDHVLNYFVEVFDNKIDNDFWNRIAHITGGGSGPRYLQGWILAFVPFDDSGKFVLNDMKIIMETNNFGKLNTNDVPVGYVEVPVEINDNGTVYKVKICAGHLMTSKTDENTLTPQLDYVMVNLKN